jgi:hypothetical protein
MKRAFMFVIFSILFLSIKMVCADGIEIGDYVQLGKYNNHPIVWRVVGEGGNGDSSLLLISDKVLTLKAFDAKIYHVNDFDYAHPNYSDLKGSNLWSTSSLRTWLNSTDSSVSWTYGDPPVEGNVKDGIGAYDSEPGFLSSRNFTEAELSLLLPYTYNIPISYKHVSGWPATASAKNLKNFWIHFYSDDLLDIIKNYNGPSSFYGIVLDNTTEYPLEQAAYETLTDRIFLPSVIDVFNMKEPPASLGRYPFGIEYYMAKPTGEASMEYGLYFDIKEDGNWPYWIRDPVAQSTDDSLVRVVGTDSRIWYDSAYNGALGVRPECYLNNNETIEVLGSGTEKSPYVILSSIELGFGNIEYNDNMVFGNVVNNTGAGVNACLYAAIVDEKKLEDVYALSIEFEENGERVIPFNFLLDDKHKGRDLILYLWDENLKPITFKRTLTADYRH